MKKILVTGSVGFIGFSVSLKLLQRGNLVLGIDNHNNYYDPKIKKDRLKKLLKYQNYKHTIDDISNRSNLDKFFKVNKPTIVLNLAAQAGVRYSLQNPEAYVKSNILGFLNILENCRYNKIEHLVYASTSSVYGANTKMPFTESDTVGHPLSFYAASKKSNELMAHTYSHLFNLPTTGLRFFTVYGPWGRPDMALFKFTKSILEEKTIDVFNYGKHSRDFTYIDDIVEAVVKILDRPATSNNLWNSNMPDQATSKAPYKIYNIGNSKPTHLMDYINALENSLNKKAKINYLPLQPGDVQDTYASTNSLKKDFNYKPSTSVNFGISCFVKWYRDYFKK